MNDPFLLYHKGGKIIFTQACHPNKKIQSLANYTSLKNLLLDLSNKKSTEKLPFCLLHTLFQHATLISAAGGKIVNPKNQILLIYKNGFWDLPKGKIEYTESPKKAAKREIKEETGLEVNIHHYLSSTFHYFLIHQQIYVKQTQWFFCQSKGGKIVLETKEGIQDYQWMDDKSIKKNQKEIYPLIYNLLKDA